MDKTFTIPATQANSNDIHIVYDVEISHSALLHVLRQNKDYFDLMSSVQATKFKFQLNDKEVIMRTFDPMGREAATYCVKEDGRLWLYKERVLNSEVYTNNVLKLVEYDENDQGEIRYRILNQRDLDPVGDSFSFDEGISFIDNSNPYHYSYDSDYIS